MRPPATIVNSVVTTAENPVEISIIAARGFWIVTLAGAAINVRTRRTEFGRSIYVKTGFPSAKPAINMAARLNQQFNTDQFCVVKAV